ncbi:MAG TPA: head GIN domain-containing protein [Chitinophagaceae bacterium]|nr:head GIN domain-containing protein [Chitinophagaceae bacterium]
MKKIFSLFVVALLSSSMLLQAQVNKTSDKDKPKIEGSGNVITKDVSVQPFDQLASSGIFSVILKQGDKEDVKIEADDNLQDLFEVKSEGSKLSISMKKDVNFSSKKGMKVYVTFKKLKSMELNMVGSLTSDNNLSFDDLDIKNKSVGAIDLTMTAQNLNVDNKSVGNINLNGKAESAVIINKGVGSIKAGDFVVQKMDIENSGVGSAVVNAEKELKVKDSFLGKVSNKGNAPVKRMNKVVI